MNNTPTQTMDEKIRTKVRELAILLQIHPESNDLFDVNVDEEMRVMSIQIDLEKI